MIDSYFFKYRLQVFFVLLFLCSSFCSLASKHSDRLSAPAIAGKIYDISFYSSSDSIAEPTYLFKGKGNLFYATLPMTLATSDLKIKVICSNNATVKINGLDAVLSSSFYDDQMVSVATADVNINKTIHIEVISSIGIHSEYDVLAQKGIGQIDSVIYDFKEKYNIPGVSFAIANLDSLRTSYSAGYGYAIKESKERVTPSHLFRLASMSKQHTAIAILKLIEEGKFGIDDTVFGEKGILKEVFPIVPAKAQRITVRHLLEHTSGYRTYPDYMFDNPYKGWPMEQRIRAMLRSNLPNEPGSVFAYYNTGYGVLGYIVEKVSGKSYEQYLKDLYGSVGVDDIHVGGVQSERRPNEVAYYGQNRANADGLDMTVRASAGGLITSTEQLIKLLWRLDGNDSIPDIINNDTRQMMFTPSKVGKSRYALGWRANHDYFPDSFYHGGTLAGVATLWVYSEGYVVIILCNSRSPIRQFDNDLYRIARDMIYEASFMKL